MVAAFQALILLLYQINLYMGDDLSPTRRLHARSSYRMALHLPRSQFCRSIPLVLTRNSALLYEITRWQQLVSSLKREDKSCKPHLSHQLISSLVIVTQRMRPARLLAVLYCHPLPILQPVEVNRVIPDGDVCLVHGMFSGILIAGPSV